MRVLPSIFVQVFPHDHFQHGLIADPALCCLDAELLNKLRVQAELRSVGFFGRTMTGSATEVRMSSPRSCVSNSSSCASCPLAGCLSLGGYLHRASFRFSALHDQLIGRSFPASSGEYQCQPPPLSVLAQYKPTGLVMNRFSDPTRKHIWTMKIRILHRQAST